MASTSHCPVSPKRFAASSPELTLCCRRRGAPICAGYVAHGRPIARSRLRRFITRQPCCRHHHAGDWGELNRLAEQHLDAALAASAGADVDEIAAEAIEDAGYDDWTTDALLSLVEDPIQLEQPDEGSQLAGFINGQHRVQAMRDARAQRTIVAYYYYDE